MPSFTNKLLRATLVLPEGTFSGTNSNTLVLANYRMSARMERAGNWTNVCNLTIYGMLLADMQSVTVLFGQGGSITEIDARAILILESNDGSGWYQVFEGQFQQAQPDFRNIPYVNLTLMAATAAGQQYLAAPPSSFSGSISVAQLASQLASQMGFQFQNNGVTGSLTSPYLPGTLMDQFRELAESAPFDYFFDAKGVLNIAPQQTGIADQPPVVVNAQSGQIGYATLDQYGITVDVLFTPAIQPGYPIQLTGQPLQTTNGLWYVRSAQDELESVKPDGLWHSRLQCSPYSGSSA